jgi:hypothetical protein
MTETEQSAESAAARQSRLDQIKRDIAAGRYETPERLDAAVDAFIHREAKGNAGPAKPK